jgi:hypothetical protein
MLILLLPVTTIVVALVGFYVWHRQLVRKRLFEVADTALSAFCRAEAAIAQAREPTLVAGEGATRKRGDHELPAYSGLLDRLYIPVERLKAHKEAFAELERAAVSAEVHFGSDVAQQLREPLRAYQRIAVATACRMSNVGLSEQAKVNPALVRRWEAVVYAGARYGVDPDDIDQLSIDMDEAWRAVDAALRPYVEAPTFSEFLLHQDVRASIGCHLGNLFRLGRHRDRPGYGKLAVYATAPLTGPDQ